MKTHSILLLGSVGLLKMHAINCFCANFRTCVLEMPVVATYLLKLKIKGLFTPWKMCLKKKKKVLCRSSVFNSVMVEAQEFLTDLCSGFCSLSSNWTACAN